MTNTLTIQDRIIKSFDKQSFVKGELTNHIFGDGNFFVFDCPVCKELARQFLIQSIKEVEEETRKETLDEVNKYMYPENNYNDFTISKENWDKLLSITNKDKQK